MLSLFLLVASSVPSLSVDALAPESRSVSYTVCLEDPDSRIVHVTAEIEGAEETAELRLPEKFAFAGLPEPMLTGPVEREVAAGVWEPIERKGPFAWTTSLNDGRATLRWSVDHAFREHEVVRNANDAFEFPYVAADHAMLVAGALLIAPGIDAPGINAPGIDAEDADAESTGSDHYSVRFELPEGWGIHAPWPSDGDVFLPADLRSLQSNLIAVGSWDAVVVQAEGAEVTLAFAPGQELARENVVPNIGPVLKSAMISFDHKPFDRYLVLFGRADQRGFGGSPKATSMTMSVNEDMLGPGAVGHVVHLIAHEFHHTWSMSRYDAPSSLRFFNEGFTDYYAYLLPERVGLTTPQAIADSVATGLASWEQNPAAAEHSLESAGGPVFFEDRNALDLIYKGGLVIGALIDARLRADGQGDLDGFMRSFNNDPRWSKGGEAPDLEEFSAVLTRHVAPEFVEQVMGWIRSPGFPDPEELAAAFLDAGVDVVREVGPASLGLRANFEGATITAIDPTDVAFRLGLRDGDRLIEVNGVDVTDNRSIGTAWENPVDGRAFARYERGGEERVIDALIPKAITYSVSPARWE